VALLLLIGFGAGIVTAISPCVLPVLPIVLAGSVGETRRRPYAVVAGLVASFTIFTLVAAWLLNKLGLPQNLLRNAAIVLLFVLAAALVFPQLGLLLERPFARLSRRSNRDFGGGFLLGVSLGLVFVPCAGPVLAVITVKAASMSIGVETVLLTLAYALGAAVPLLAIAAGGQRVATRLRPQAARLRVGAGILIALATLAIVFHLDTKAQTALGDYTGWLQGKVERNAKARNELDKLRGGGGGVAQAASAPGLEDYGPAPDFASVSHWLNTPGDRPLTIAGLRGKVVLVDFWTYSCINCIRTFPHLRAWDAAYRRDGLVIVGVHTPEFAFEHVLSNVRDATHRFRLRYPVALDNRFGTWNAYGNQYWPAEYLIDRRGHVRHAHFGEGEYDRTENLIRRLLSESPNVRLGGDATMPDETPTHLTTPESYLGTARIDRYVGSTIAEGRETTYRFARTLPQNDLSYAGRWVVGRERIVAGGGARLRVHFRAQHVYLVLGGEGRLRALVDGRSVRTIRVNGDRLYTILDLPQLVDAVLELRFTPGISAFAFTFG
jgi:cytochrome c biogenesis protein CcdA/thiol-disulfide isomerase/thioredoxin